MSSGDEETQVRQRIRTMQIVLVSLIVGVLVLLSFALVKRGLGNMAPAPPVPLVTYVVLVHAFIVTAAFMFVPNLAVTTGRRRLTQGTTSSPAGSADIRVQLAALLLTRMIIGGALL